MSAVQDFPAFLASLRVVRHELHEHPERSFKEFNTQVKLEEFLVNVAKIPRENIKRIASTGLMVDVHGPVEGASSSQLKCVAIRADMDALPMTEHNPHLAYESKETQCAHMCGHDGHMATLLGFAVLINERRHLLPANTIVRLLFQPAEEGHFGAPVMIKDGCLEGVNEVYGYHNIPFPVGTVRVKPGPMMSHSSRFTIKIQGPGGHGSAPHQTQDPIVAAGHVIVGLQTIISRNISAHDSGVLSVTQVHGGEADNVIPSLVTLSGTCRDFSPDVYSIIQSRMRSIVQHTSEAYGVTGSIEFREGYPVVVNSPDQSQIVEDIGKRVVGASSVSAEGLPSCASEDFSYYLQQRPGCFFFIGTVDSTESQNRTIHSDTFDFNDAILPIGIRMFLELVNHRLACSVYTEDELKTIYNAKVTP